MASVTRKTFRCTGFLPTPAEIEAHTAEFKQRKLEEIANRPDPAEADRRIAREKLRQRRKARRAAAKAEIEAKRLRSFTGDAADDYQPKYRVPVPEGGPREMTKADIANVEILRFGDVDPMLDMVIDAASAQNEAEDFNCRWGLGGDPDDFDLADYDDAPVKFGVVG